MMLRMKNYSAKLFGNLTVVENFFISFSLSFCLYTMLFNTALTYTEGRRSLLHHLMQHHSSIIGRERGFEKRVGGKLFSQIEFARFVLIDTFM